MGLQNAAESNEEAVPSQIQIQGKEKRGIKGKQSYC